jgi:superfamily I DNA and/or RNA helicase
MDKVIFPHVIIDESAQTTEPAALLAISHGCEKLVLIGDHKQLPAVILSKEAQRLGLNVSLFERLISEGTPPSVLLNVQRRMHPSIAEWPSKAFYENKLDSGAPLFTMLPSSWTLLGQSKRVVFVDTDGIGGGEEQQGTSTRNLGESKVLINVVSRLVDSGISAENVGVIVPYLAQKALVQKNIKLPGLWVNTVEGFQGHEKDFIVISTTRSNTVGSIGFLEDERRMNVMLTRAKQGLVVVGDKHTLKKRSNGKWADWFNWCESHGSVIHHHSI